ncbi:MAG: thermonuclease family protein [Pseudomonadota bacterium]
MNDRFLWGLAAAGLAAVIAWLFVPSTGNVQSRQSIEGRVIRIVDGDGLYIRGHEPQIRIWGIDAPERDEKGFQAATDALARLAYGKTITCQIMDQDRYGRTVGRCILPDGRDIARILVEDLHAVEYCRYSKGFYGTCDR